MLRPALLLVLFAAAAANAAAAQLHLLPKPQATIPGGCDRVVTRALRVPAQVDAGSIELVNERWRALGIPRLARGEPADLRVTHASLPAQSYRLTIPRSGEIMVSAGDGDGIFYAFATLAQLPQRVNGRWALPCVTITDGPALQWRILSDDVSRGPLPTMRYFKERIRTIAAFKMNGYSPYMEHVFIDPRNSLPAPVDGITQRQLAELNSYAARFHVRFIPEQQTFAHMHNTLRMEQYAGLAELPHGYLLSPVNPGTYAYLAALIRAELQAVPRPVFFHIGADEPSDLGRGQSQAAVTAEGDAAVYAAHVRRVAALLPRGTHPMIWDDAIQRHPEILAQIPRSTVIVNWHYGSEPSFAPYIRTIAGRGFAQMVAPGANNWNEVYPDLDVALRNESRFIEEGKAARVLGLFQTVWHDDGETLYEATWYPVLFAASSAWEHAAVDPARFRGDFGPAFFGTNDGRLADGIVALGHLRTLLRASHDENSDYLFWSDPFDSRIGPRVFQAIDVGALRLQAEAIVQQLFGLRPPLHADAARVAILAAHRYDVLGRNFQIAKEARDYYDDARAHADGKHDNLVFRGLFIAKYLLWEMRDEFGALEAEYRAAWDYENRPGHRQSVLERYHAAARRAIERADLINAMTYEEYVRHHNFPSFDHTLGLAQ